MFEPPRCPNVHCTQHKSPGKDFYIRKGYFHPRCRSHPVPRFRCRFCRKGFSRQTFRADYRDHRPDVNGMVFWLLISGVGLRQTARYTGLTFRCIEMKFRKIGRHLRGLNTNLRGFLPADSRLQFDELETYEGRRNTRPLTVPVLIERSSRFVIWGESAPIRPRGKMTEARLRAIAEDEKRYGPRHDESRACCLKVLSRGAHLVRDHEKVVFESDEKSTYPILAKQVFGEERLEHLTTSSKLVRGTWNRLFPINHTEAMMRDNLGRMRRESWLVSKKGWCLDLGVQYFFAYRNYVRSRFNWEKETPAQQLGFVKERLTVGRVLGWRQDWGELSIHPESRRGEAVEWPEGAWPGAVVA